jgi:hypothetical protein
LYHSVVWPDDAAMGPGWGGNIGEGVPSSVNPTFDAEPNSLLSGFLWVGLLRIVDAVARPVTPELRVRVPALP